MSIFETARRLDYDRTLAAGYARAGESLLTLIAYNGELGAIRTKVTDPITHEIRLLWWKEAIEDLAKDKVRKHPLVQDLQKAINLGELDPDMLVVMAEGRYQEFQEPAQTFDDFIEARRSFLQAHYMNTILALRMDEIEADQSAFLGFDLLGCLAARHFYQGQGIVLFHGAPDWDKIQKPLRAKTSHSYFQALQALSDWYLKHLKKSESRGRSFEVSAQHPGKILSLWRKKWLG